MSLRTYMDKTDTHGLQQRFSGHRELFWGRLKPGRQGDGGRTSYQLDQGLGGLPLDEYHSSVDILPHGNYQGIANNNDRITVLDGFIDTTSEGIHQRLVAGQSRQFRKNSSYTLQVPGEEALVHVGYRQGF